MTSRCLKWLLFIVAASQFFSCSKNSSIALFKKLSPHDQYAQRLKDAGLDHTALGGAWLQSASQSIGKAVTISIPYKETGFFEADKIQVTALRFEAKRGEKLHIALNKKPELNFRIYIDILQQQPDQQFKTVAYADTLGIKLDYEVTRTGAYVLRLQPELLRGGQYTLSISIGPSLHFPVSMVGHPSIGSFWGDSRDEGGRQHEGIDIFAPKGTPAIAADDGTVVNVGENKLGGNVVFMRPEGKDYTLYYAHLGKQLVHNGQTVKTGDTIGLIDNSGNAKNTPSHLHFGVYTTEGAVDPLPFVSREIKVPHPITAPLNYLNATVRTTSEKVRLFGSPATDEKPISRLPVNTIMNVEGITTNWYRVTLPDGTKGFVNSADVRLASSLSKVTIIHAQLLYNTPDTTTASPKASIPAGTRVNVLGEFKNYILVNDASNNTGWIIVGVHGS
jgi:murein DD-endopeptidase MepM/ murein hydrolase activator NlpD